MKPSLAFPKPSKRKKGKVSQRKTLVAKLDRVFSQYIRQRDGNRCCSCGRDNLPVDCGHFVSRRVLKLRWDEFNAASQCLRCNRFLAGAGAQFAAFIVRRHGESELLRLDRDSREVWKPTLDELRELLGHFQERLSGLSEMPLKTHQSDGGEFLAKTRGIGSATGNAPGAVDSPLREQEESTR